VTLVEIAIGLVIAGMIASISLPKLNFNRLRADAGSRVARIALQRAARLAVTQQHDMVVGFDVPGNRMRVLEDRNSNGTADPGEPVNWKSFPDGSRFVTPPNGVNTPGGAAVVSTGLSTVDGYPSVIFHRDGQASTALELFVDAGGGARPEIRAVTLMATTGRCESFRWSGTSWTRGSL
jgi:Tfp pilus assembly protein FimT